MPTGQPSSVIRHLRRIAIPPTGDGMTDGQLLEGFLARREEQAFEALVRRHGPMVLGVCRRVAGNAHDAEDAFQATFLVLVRKAAGLLPRAEVGNWLYGVAYHTALKARATAWRRRAREAQVGAMSRVEVPAEDTQEDWRPLLDEALSRLPDKYRAAVVLCDLEGKTRRQAARDLGVPEGTLSGRLTTARRQLARRLAARGVTGSGVAFAAALSSGSASAAVPAPLVVSTVRAAARLAAGGSAAGLISARVAALTEGVLKAMSATRFKVQAAFVVVLGLLASGGLLGYRAPAAGPAADPPVAARDKAATPAPRPAVAQRPNADRARGGPTVSGPVQAVDADKLTVTVAVFSRKDGESTDRTFPVARDAKILKDGAPAKLADLKQGSRATLHLSADQATVVAITLAGRTVTGDFYDAGKKTIILTVETRQGKENRTFYLAKETKVTIDDKAAALQDLKGGSPVLLRFSADDDRVIQVQTPPPGAREGND